MIQIEEEEEKLKEGGRKKTGTSQSFWLWNGWKGPLYYVSTISA